MSVSALLRFAPVYDPRILDDPKLSRGLMIQRGGLERIRGDELIPVVVDHADPRDEANIVGRVREVFIAPDVHGGVVRDWYFASVDLTSAPGWLKRNGGVSWSHIPLRTQDVCGTTRLLRGLIKEVSILSPTVRPADGLARVAWIGEERAAPRAEQVIYGGGKLIRPNSGTVLGVR